MEPLATDEQLMAAYVASDTAAFGQLFERYAPRVYAFFVRSFGRKDVADDLVQTTFLKLHSARASYEQGRPFRPWLFTIAARVRLDELRRRYRVPATAGDDEVELAAANDPSPLQNVEAREQLGRIEAAFAKLTPNQRTVIQLHRVEGLSFAQIGAIMNVQEGAARLRAFRAYERLRELLDDACSGDAGSDGAVPHA